MNLALNRRKSPPSVEHSLAENPAILSSRTPQGSPGTLPGQQPWTASLKSMANGCASPACKKSRLHQAMGWRREAMHLGDSWYCGPDCFEEGVRAQVRQLAAESSGKEVSRRSRLPLGLLLFSRGIISEQQLKLAHSRQQSTSEDFGTALHQLGFATHEEITAAVAAQWGYPVFFPGGRKIHTPVEIPRFLLEMYRILPLHFTPVGQELLLGFVDGIRHQVVSAIERMVPCSVRPCFITMTEYQRHVYGEFENLKNEIVFDRACSVPEIAKVTRNYVCQLGAEEAKFARCQSFLWARILGRTQGADLLFRMEAS
ncbi:MAG TPA: hypothetical protein VG892_02685 [Terriglobales bacterium]|nr:hypothetical protein [Terriglobales bacterium]